MGSGPTRVSDDASATRPLPSLLPGSLELVSPVSIGTTRRLRLPLFVSAPSLCRSVRDTSVPRLCSLTTDRGGVGRCSGPWFTGVALSGYNLPGTQEALPASRETLYCSALLSDPGRTSTPDHDGASVLPTSCLKRGLLHCKLFRGSMTRLCSSLPTLEGAISGASQGSLPAAGQALPSGLVPAGSQLRLSVHSFVIFPFLLNLS